MLPIGDPDLDRVSPSYNDVDEYQFFMVTSYFVALLLSLWDNNVDASQNL